MVPTKAVRRKTEQILNALGCKHHEISIVIMDDAEIRALNREFRGMDRPTNVLSFPMQEGEFSNVTPGLLGDVVISAQTAAAEAEEAGIPLDQRLSQLLVHGILHLVGFDHETGEEDARHMEIKSLELLKRIEPDNPDLPVF